MMLLVKKNTQCCGSRNRKRILSKYYSDEQLNQVINVKPKNRITIGYCRISNHKQKDDLERQIDNVRIYLQAKGQPFEIISDIGSGINYKENKLQYAGVSRFAYNWVLASEKENYEKGGRFISDPELRK